jgi:hypothetical protein
MEKVTNVPTAAEDDFPSLVNFAKEHGIGLVVAGPDDAVVNGIAGHFEDGKHTSLIVYMVRQCLAVYSCYTLLCTEQESCRS